MDLSKMSDEDLDAISKGDMSKVSDEGLQFIASQQQPEEKPSVEVKDKSIKNLFNSMLYDLVTNKNIHPNAVEPTTAAQIMNPVPATGGAISRAKGIVDSVKQGFQMAAPTVSKGAGAAATYAIIRRLERELGGH